MRSIACCCLAVAVVCTPASAAAAPSLWAWQSGSDTEAMSQIEMHQDLLTDISFGGGYGVAANGSFVAGTFPTDKDAQLKAWGLRRHPLIGCGSTATLRTLFASPAAFIQAAVSEATARGFQGYNLECVLAAAGRIATAPTPVPPPLLLLLLLSISLSIAPDFHFTPLPPRPGTTAQL